MKLFRVLIAVILTAYYALIISSCEDGVTNPVQSGENLELISFTPDTITYKTSITITGKNFSKDNILSIKVGDSTTIFTLISDDTIIVGLPELSPGIYVVQVKSISGIQDFYKKLVVKDKDFSSFVSTMKYFKFEAINMHVIKSYETYQNGYPGSSYHSISYDTLNNFYNGIETLHDLSFRKINTNCYLLKDSISYAVYNSVLMYKNPELNIFDSIFVSYYMDVNWGSPSQYQVIRDNYILKNIPFKISGGSIIFQITGTTIDSLLPFFEFHNEHGSNEGHNWSQYIESVYKRLNTTDMSVIKLVISE